MCEIRGCNLKGIRIWNYTEERWVSDGKGRKYLKGFFMKKLICNRCFRFLINNTKIDRLFWEVDEHANAERL